MCKRVWVWMVLVTLAGGDPEERQYCSARYRRLCLGKGSHVACQYPDSGPGEFCENYTKIVFKNDLKHFITNYINRRRQRVASGNERVRGGAHLPKPQIMMLVAWDRELARLAQRLANQCQFVHDQCRATVKYPFAGQTVGEVRWRRSSDSEEISAQRAIRRVFDAWWGERRRALVKEVVSPFKLSAKGTVWGHFSQLAVWNLQAVGCGAVRHGARYPRLLLVCDFSHTNMLGQKTIVPGTMAPCPTNTARRGRSAYPALCGPYRSVSHEEKELIEYEDDDDPDDIETTEDYPRIRQTEITTTYTYRTPPSPPLSCPSWTTEQTFIRPSKVTARTKIATKAIKKLWHKYNPTDVGADIIQDLEMDMMKTKTKDVHLEIKHFRKIKEKSETTDEGDEREENEEYYTEKYRPTTIYSTTTPDMKVRLQWREKETVRDFGQDNPRENGRENARESDRDNARESGRDIGRDNARESGRDIGRDNARENGRYIGRENVRDIDRHNARENGRYIGRDKSLDSYRDNSPHHVPDNTPDNDSDILEHVDTESQQEVHFREVVKDRPVVNQDKFDMGTSEATDWPVKKLDISSPPRSRIRQDIEKSASESRREDSEQDTRPRLSWRNTRFRPQRPGANGLLPSTTTYKASMVSIVNTDLKMDKEDIEQLFLDTGFKLDWKKQST